jgi:predicted nucleotidyltransferase
MNQPARLPLNPSDSIAIERIVSAVLKNHTISLRLFGSRARGDARAVSDIDLALMANPAVTPLELAEIRDALEESCIPYRIDFLDYAKAPNTLQHVIDQEGIAWPVQNSA